VSQVSGPLANADLQGLVGAAHRLLGAMALQRGRQARHERFDQRELFGVVVRLLAIEKLDDPDDLAGRAKRDADR
jgi:hypothetical protein